jgi:5-methyltetrahydrofolate--homocysteine methyltransferase
MLGAERIGLHLTDGDQLDPEHSTVALVIHHPEATYFSAHQTTREAERSQMAAAL